MYSAFHSKLIDSIFLVLLISAATAFALILIGGRVLRLSADEVYFLHEAYAYTQGWLDTAAPQSRPYDLYRTWLGIGLGLDQPGSIWHAVSIDSIAQLFCLALLTTLGVRLQPQFTWVGFGVIFVGIQFFFTIGRLAEHRPDYLAVTALSIGAIAMLRSLLNGRSRMQDGLALVSGASFAIAIALSPRALVVLVFSMLFMLPYLLSHLSFKVRIRFILFGILGTIVAITVVWLLSGFNIFSSYHSLITAETVTDNPFSLMYRFTHNARFYLTFIHFMVLAAALGVFIVTSNTRTRIYAYAAFCFAAGQIFLIIYDTQIFGYGYSYGLVAYQLVIASLLAENAAPSNRVASLIPFATFTGLVMLFVVQTPSLFDSNDYHYKWTNKRHFPVDRNSGTDKLTDLMNKGTSLVERLQSRILLCDRLPEARYVSRWHNNPICLRSAYINLAGIDITEPTTFGSVQYPKNQAELNRILVANGQKKEIKGMLILEMDSETTIKVFPMK